MDDVGIMLGGNLLGNIETASQNLRHALRLQRRSWSFIAVAIPTLALGIGTPAAIFSGVNAVIFKMPCLFVN